MKKQENFFRWILIALLSVTLLCSSIALIINACRGYSYGTYKYEGEIEGEKIRCEITLGGDNQGSLEILIDPQSKDFDPEILYLDIHYRVYEGDLLIGCYDTYEVEFEKAGELSSYEIVIEEGFFAKEITLKNKTAVFNFVFNLVLMATSLIVIIITIIQIVASKLARKVVKAEQTEEKTESSIQLSGNEIAEEDSNNNEENSTEE